RDYSNAIEIDKKVAAAFNARIRAYARDGEYRNPIEDYDKLVELQPNGAFIMDQYYAGSFFDRGRERMRRNLFSLAVIDFKRAIEWGLKNLETYNELSGAAYLAKDWASLFTAACRDALALTPKDVTALNFCGLFHLDSTSPNYQEAIRYFSLAIDS